MEIRGQQEKTLTVPALQQVFSPHSISIDIHASTMMKGMKYMDNLMSKLMAMGISI